MQKNYAIRSATPPAVPSPATVAALEKIPSAARRMGCSTSQFYRIAKRDGLTIVKVGERASAAIEAEVSAWVANKINVAKGGK